MAKVIVYHEGFGCDTGCCGHTVELGENTEFIFDHPDDKESPLDFAKRMVTEAFGAEHVADLDWENCNVSND
jgi:hypothetical protein